jgi:hypothetical protein
MACCSHGSSWIELLHTLSKDNGVVILCWDFSTPRIEICFPTLPIVEAFSTAIDDRYFTNGVAFIAYIPINSGVKPRSSIRFALPDFLNTASQLSDRLQPCGISGPASSPYTSFDIWM